MPRVPVYEGGNVQDQGTTSARVATVDNGPGVGAGVAQLGQAVSRFAEVNDQIHDLHDQTNARAKALEHMKFLQTQNQQVLGAKNADAAPAVNAASKALSDYNGTLLASAATPRERRYLQEQIEPRSIAATDNWETHGHSEFVQYRNATDNASVANIVQSAKLADPRFGDAMMGFEGPPLPAVTHPQSAASGPGAPTGTAPAPTAGGDAPKAAVTAKQIILDNLDFNGVHDPEIRRQALLKQSSDYYLERSRQLLDQSGDANKATGYVREKMSAGLIDADKGDAIIAAYRPEALQQTVRQLVAGHPFPSSPDVQGTAPAPDAEQGDHRLSLGAAFQFIAAREGSAYVTDVNGAGVKYGINAAANPGVDVKHLTYAGAQQIFENKYWHKSGADQLPPALAIMHADTFYIGEAGAKRILRESDGDPTRYMELRRQWMADMVAKNPAKFGRVANGWENRNKALEQYASTLGGDGRPVPPVTIDTTNSQIRPYWEGRTDLPLDVRLAAADEAIRQRNELKSERDSQESEAARQAQTVINGLDAKGTGITSLGQLPTDLVSRLSPTAIASIQSQIKTNTKAEEIKVTPETEYTLNYTKAANPLYYSSPEFFAAVAAKLPPDRRARLAAEQGAIRGDLAHPKPEHTSDGDLLSTAKDPLYASGIDLDPSKTKAPPGSTAAQTAYTQSNQVLSALKTERDAWEAKHPGQKADETTKRQWVSNVMLNVAGTKHQVWNATDDELVGQIPLGNKAYVVRLIQSQGGVADNHTIAETYRRLRVAHNLDGRH